MLLVLAVFACASLAAPSLLRALGRRAFFVLPLVPAFAFVHTLTLAPAVLDGGAEVEKVRWVAGLSLNLSFRMDLLSWVMSLLVTGVGALVLLYCARYFRDDEEGLARFGAVLLAFAGVMYGLVVADDLIVLFIFWEATTVLSYLLIGHFNTRKQARRAALQALIVTTAGGLAMLVGLVMLAAAAGTPLLSEILAHPPSGSLTTTAILLILVGALSKSALVPFHFWLPAAMAAPTPVSAYLHAAAMVKAGIYLIARLAPGFAGTPGWRETLISLGVLTMLVGGWRALRQSDLKLLLAYGTVSQLGFLTIMMGFGTRDTALAGLALLLAHGLFKATLFLVVGIVDHRAGTRDLRKLSGLGRQAPVLAVLGIVSAASMAGVPPLAGFVAKEAVYTSLLESAGAAGWLGYLALAGVFLGSVFTVAYSARFVWGAFCRKPGVKDVDYVREHIDFMVAPGILAVLTLAGGILATALDPVLAGYADTVARPGEHPYHLALWHGPEPALLLTAVTLAAGLAAFFGRAAVARWQDLLYPVFDANRSYRRIMLALDRFAVFVTARTQRGSLPIYLGVILAVLVAALGGALVLNRTWPAGVRLWDYPGQLAIAVLMGGAAIVATRANRRFVAVVVVGVTGYGMSVLFALQGAPDLALTQMLVETITLVAFVLVLRRLPIRIGQAHGSVHRKLRLVIGVVVGALMSTVAYVALAARSAEPISSVFPRLAYEGGHGKNVVNVILVDIRAWDTLGEISVLVVAATGVASLIFLRQRTSTLERLNERARPRSFSERHRPVREPVIQLHAGAAIARAGDADPRADGAPARRADPLGETAVMSEPPAGADVATAPLTGENDAETQSAWLLAGRTLAPHNRSILLEVVVRLLFHSAIVFSVFLLFSGHNMPGGGFAGGLVAGLALVARYLAGGRYELAEAAPIDAGKLLGAGLVLAGGTGAVGLFAGADVLQSTWWSWDIPLLGHVELVSTTFFDIGVYLVVVGLMLDVLRSLGAEVDRQQEEDHEAGEAEDHPSALAVSERVGANDADTSAVHGPMRGNTL